MCVTFQPTVCCLLDQTGPGGAAQSARLLDAHATVLLVFTPSDVSPPPPPVLFLSTQPTLSLPLCWGSAWPGLLLLLLPLLLLFLSTPRNKDGTGAWHHFRNDHRGLCTSSYSALCWGPHAPVPRWFDAHATCNCFVWDSFNKVTFIDWWINYKTSDGAEVYWDAFLFCID